jgi:hypothetical protein
MINVNRKYTKIINNNKIHLNECEKLIIYKDFSGMKKTETVFVNNDKKWEISLLKLINNL